MNSSESSKSLFVHLIGGKLPFILIGGKRPAYGHIDQVEAMFIGLVNQAESEV